MFWMLFWGGQEASSQPEEREQEEARDAAELERQSEERWSKIEEMEERQ